MAIKTLKFPTQIESKDFGTVYEIQDVRRFMKEWNDGKMLAKWDTWYCGQTGGIVGNKFCVYDYDFRRFCEQQGLLIV